MRSNMVLGGVSARIREPHLHRFTLRRPRNGAHIYVSLTLMTSTSCNNFHSDAIKVTYFTGIATPAVIV